MRCRSLGRTDVKEPVTIKEQARRVFSWVGAQRLTRSLIPDRYRRGFVLMYHRILPSSLMPPLEDPSRCLAVSTGVFEQQLRYLARTVELTGVTQALEGAASPASSPRVAITFDDGYRDNLEYALPVLERLGIPATVYVCTRFPEGETAMWWFELWNLICESSGTITLVLGNDCASLSRDTRGPAARRATYWTLFRALRDCSEERQQQLLEQLRAHRREMQFPEICLGWNELSRFASHPLITIGAHGHGHLNLGRESSDRIRGDLIRCKSLLAGKIGEPVDSLAYPYGERRLQTINIALSLGFHTALTTDPTRMTGASALEVPRFAMTEEHGTFKMDGLLAGWNALCRRH